MKEGDGKMQEWRRKWRAEREAERLAWWNDQLARTEKSDVQRRVDDYLGRGDQGPWLTCFRTLRANELTVTDDPIVFAFAADGLRILDSPFHLPNCRPDLYRWELIANRWIQPAYTLNQCAEMAQDQLRRFLTDTRGEHRSRRGDWQNWVQFWRRQYDALTLWRDYGMVPKQTSVACPVPMVTRDELRQREEGFLQRR